MGVKERKRDVLMSTNIDPWMPMYVKYAASVYVLYMCNSLSGIFMKTSTE